MKNPMPLVIVVLVSFILWLAIPQSEANHQQPKSPKKIKKDTAYVIIANFKDSGNYDYRLIFDCKGQKHKIFTEKVEDGGYEELLFDYDFQGLGLKYKCFEDYDGIAGTCVSILWDRKTNYFYKTERYDLSASGDSLVRNLMNFQRKTAYVGNAMYAFYKYELKQKPERDSIYAVKLYQIWPRPIKKKK